jgi:hypothetical protein
MKMLPEPRNSQKVTWEPSLIELEAVKMLDGMVLKALRLTMNQLRQSLSSLRLVCK